MTRGPSPCERCPTSARYLLRPTFPPGGFTLIELALVCVVLGILLAASMPRFQQTAQRLRLEQGAFALRQFLQYAHERAVSENSTIRWVWNPQAHRAHLEQEQSLSSAATPPGESSRVDESAPLPKDAIVTLARDRQAVTCNCLRFFPDGTSEPTVLTISQDEQTYTVSVDQATGQTRLTTGTAAR